MNGMRKLAAVFTSAAAIATLFTVSASAETRHRDETTTTTNLVDRRDANNNHDGWRRDGQTQSNDRTTRNDQRRADSRDQNTYRGNRNYDRNNNSNDRNYGRSEQRSVEQRGYDRNRSTSRNDVYRNESRYDSRGRQSFNGQGRVDRFRHENGGYRVWLQGSRYPFWIPEARWRSFPLRVGLSVRIGGWLDPLGYIDAYDIGPYGGGPVYTSGQLRGVVESVDFRRGTLVLRDDLSGNFVTAVMRDGRMDNLRPGDYVAVSGDWTRGGVFEAYRLDDVRDGY